MEIVSATATRRDVFAREPGRPHGRRRLGHERRIPVALGPRRALHGERRGRVHACTAIDAGRHSLPYPKSGSGRKTTASCEGAGVLLRSASALLPAGRLSVRARAR